jgi:hypothetical protein
VFSGYLAFDEADPVVGSHGDDAHHGELIDGRREYDGIAEDVRQLWHQQVDALILERRESYIKSVSIPAEDARKNMCLPWLTVKMDFSGLRRKATQIMIVQIDIEEPVIQNMNRVMNICFDGDFANSQAFYSTKLILGMHKYVDQKVSYILHDLNLR